MVNQELREYIATCRRAGQSDEQIASTLTSNGWDRADITAGLSEQSATVPTPVNLVAVKYGDVVGKLTLLALGVILPFIVIELFGYISRRGFWLTSIMEITAAALGVVAAFFMLWFGLSAACYVSRASEGVGAAMNHALRRIHSYLWILLLMELIVQLGNVLFIIPGIIFAVWFSFSVFTLAQEDARGLGALLKSKEYVRGHWWRVFGTLLLLMLGLFVIMAVCLGATHVSESRIVILGGYAALAICILLYYPFALVRFYNLFAKIKNQKGIVAVPEKSRTLFTVFAILGVIVVIGIMVAGAMTVRYTHRPQHAHSDMNMYHDQPMIPASGYHPDIQMQ